MIIAHVDCSKVYVRRLSDGEIVAEISDTVTEELDGYEIDIVMTCEAVED